MHPQNTALQHRSIIHPPIHQSAITPGRAAHFRKLPDDLRRTHSTKCTVLPSFNSSSSSFEVFCAVALPLTCSMLASLPVACRRTAHRYKKCKLPEQARWLMMMTTIPAAGKHLCRCHKGGRERSERNRRPVSINFPHFKRFRFAADEQVNRFRF